MGKFFIESILETLADGAKDSAHLFVAISKAGYGASRKDMEREFRKLSEKAAATHNKEELSRRKHSFYSLLNYLKRDGLIEKDGGWWVITSPGKVRLSEMRKRPRRKYIPSDDDTLKIVMFDIPERERWKRDWIRDALIGLEFKLVQKSVWAGKKKLPKNFLEDLKTYKLLGCVDIYSVAKSGTLRGFVEKENKQNKSNS